MALNKEQKDKFIELRAKGFSFDSITKELKISKPTLIKLNKEFEKEIANLTYLNFQNLLEQYQLTRQKRFENLLSILDKVNLELNKRELKDLSFKELYNIKTQLETKLIVSKSSIKYNTGEYKEMDFSLNDEIKLELE